MTTARNAWERFWSKAGPMQFAGAVIFLAVFGLLVFCAVAVTAGPLQIKTVEMLNGELEQSYTTLWVGLPLWIRVTGIGVLIITVLGTVASVWPNRAGRDH